MVDLRKDKVKFNIIPKTNEESTAVKMVVLDLLIVIVSYQRVWIN